MKSTINFYLRDKNKATEPLASGKLPHMLMGEPGDYIVILITLNSMAKKLNLLHILRICNLLGYGKTSLSLK